MKTKVYSFYSLTKRALKLLIQKYFNVIKSKQLWQQN